MQTLTEPGVAQVDTQLKTLGTRVRIEMELKHLRRRLADAWWFERSLEEIQEIETMIAARRSALRELA